MPVPVWFSAENALGPLFKVEDAARYFGPEEIGLVVTHRETGNMILTGVGGNMDDAAQRLLDHARNHANSLPTVTAAQALFEELLRQDTIQSATVSLQGGKVFVEGELCINADALADALASRNSVICAAQQNSLSSKSEGEA